MRCRFAVAVVLLAAASAAFGHAVVVESTPRDGAELAVAPGNVELRFNVRIEPALARASLKSGSGRPVPLELDATASAQSNRIRVSLPPLAPGAYELRYQVLATDGHTTQGLLRFRIRR
jgi:methionine-rich copper-binding protein CopC